MKAIVYFLTRLIFYFYSYELEIIDPPKRKSLTRVPTVFRVHGSKWWTILLGAATFLVVIAGLSQLAPSSAPPPKGEIISYSITGIFITLAFINQLVLKGRIIVHQNQVEFNYRNVFGYQNSTVELSDYSNIWIQKMKTRNSIGAHDGRSYVKIRLKHSWNRFRSIELFEGNKDESKIQFYSELFDLPPRESIVTIRGKYV